LRTTDIVQQNGAMQQRALQTVLLVHAIEATDWDGQALSTADRTGATSAAAEEGPLPAPGAEGAPLGADSERFLVRRAEALLARLRVRSPGIDRVLAAADGATGLDRATLLLAFAVGVAISFADGTRIGIFAYPLLGLVVWNLIVYLLLIARVFRQRAEGSRLRDAFGRLYARRVRARIDALIAHSIGFNAPLAPGLRRFAADWWEIGRPVFSLRARRLLHLAAILVAVGLMAGYGFRGWILREPAGWSTTVFGPASAHAALTVLYGPASAISGVALPSAAEIRSLIWTGPASGGGSAGGWLYLIDWTALLYIVFPRLLALVASTFALWRQTAKLRPPASLSREYLREILSPTPPPPALADSPPSEAPDSMP
jgi:hypothetical protein